MAINTSNIVIPDDIKELIELLAENIHDKWGNQRHSEGWSYGPTRDDVLKTHPGLVSYHALSESEKEYDRITALETIKVILKLGFIIERPSVKLLIDEQKDQGEQALFVLKDDRDVDRAERFEIAFNHIHRLLKGLLMDSSDSVPFVSLVHELSRKHVLIAREASKLKQYAKLRNALVHEFYGKSDYIAVPHEHVVVDIERIKRLLSTPPKALSISSKQVLYMRHDDELIFVMRQMGNYQCTSVPIYQEKQFIGLLTEDGINRWLVKHLDSTSRIEFSGVTTYEVLQYELKTNVIFMTKETSVYEIEDIFEQRMFAKQKIDAIIITESGNDHQFPIGIITSWDLIKID